MKNEEKKSAEKKTATENIYRDPYGVDLSKSYVSACSATDCTGLIPSLPQSKAEIESYESIYHFMPKGSEPKEL